MPVGGQVCLARSCGLDANYFLRLNAVKTVTIKTIVSGIASHKNNVPSNDPFIDASCDDMYYAIQRNAKSIGKAIQKVLFFSQFIK